jgi:hypothetical protein
MNAIDVLRYGHGTVLETIERVPEDAWDAPGAAGDWSPKDVLGHLSAFELLLAEVLESLDGGAMPLAEAMNEQGGDAWNESQWARRRDLPARAIIDEYTHAFEHVISLAARVPEEAFSQNGLLAWYGDGYDLDDFITYTSYGHKREHTAQIGAFLDRWSPDQ